MNHGATQTRTVNDPDSMILNIVSALIPIALFAFIQLASPTFSYANDNDSKGVDGFITDNLINVGGTRESEEDVGLSESSGTNPEIAPYIYRYERVCVVDSSDISVECEIQRLQCQAGENGILVQWYRALAVSPDSWTALDSPVCIYSNEPIPAEQELPVLTIQDFKELPIAAAASTVQPSPHTLRGANTNMYAEASEQNFTEDIVGFTVDVIATPVSYVWDYGDGQVVGPVESPGTQLPQNRWGEQTETSHVYTETGDFAVVLTTYFTGQYSVDGGPWIPIPGQAAVTSEQASVSVWRAVTNNYADNCLENPGGAGC